MIFADDSQEPFANVVQGFFFKLIAGFIGSSRPRFQMHVDKVFFLHLLVEEKTSEILPAQTDVILLSGIEKMYRTANGALLDARREGTQRKTPNFGKKEILFF